jgi:hypothetical protein
MPSRTVTGVSIPEPSCWYLRFQLNAPKRYAKRLKRFRTMSPFQAFKGPLKLWVQRQNLPE